MSTPHASSEPGSLEFLLAQLPQQSTQRGRAFERICKWFLESDPRYRSLLRDVWLWDEWPGRWGADAGIDLVAEDHFGGLWAIQAKAYEPATTITKADLDTFLAESSRPGFVYRLLLATTDRIGRRALQTLSEQAVPAGTLLLSELLTTELIWPASLTTNASAAPARAPRPHQIQARDEVVSGLQLSDRGHLVMACGTGKTLTSFFIAEALKANSVLFLVPSLSLLGQVILEWASASDRGFRFLAVCSDESVVARPGEDPPVASPADLSVPVVSDPEQVAAFLVGGQNGKLRAVFATYQSSHVVAAAQNLPGVPEFDLTVADEAHRLAGEYSSSAFATVLHDAQIRSRKRLFMTATPRYATGRVIKAAKEHDLEVASMDDPELFGPRLHTLTFGRAIELGLLTDYQVAIIGIDDERHRDWAKRGVLVRADGPGNLDARTLAAHVGVAKAMREFDIRRAISFHTRVAAARSFSEQHEAVLRWLPPADRPAGTITCDHVSGRMSAGERRRRMEAFRNPNADRALLANARCLTEGIDVPTLDGVAFLDPRRSEVDIVQAVGRAIRLSPDKRLGTIVLPVFVGPENPEEAIEGSSFKPVWDVLNALRAHDEVLAAELDELRRALPSSGIGSRLPGKIRLDLPSWVGPDFAGAVRAQIVENTTSGWEMMLALLHDYVAREGDARVPTGHCESGQALGRWVIKQRYARRGGRLTREREVQLGQLPGWEWDPRHMVWEEGFQRLQEYVRRHGTARVPRHEVVDGFRLGDWVKSQRGRHDGGELSEDRCRRLEDLPGWSWDPFEDQWSEAYAVLETFVRRTGSARVPRNQVEDGFPLGSWCSTQRWFRREGQLAPGRQQRLESLPGWIWDPREAQWEEYFELLSAHLAAQAPGASIRIPYSLVVADVRLGAWAAKQRSMSRRGLLEEERRRRLEGLPGWSFVSEEAQKK